MKYSLWILITFLVASLNGPLQATAPSKRSAETHLIITSIPDSGLVINSPGKYVFNTNLLWNPSGDGQAISIQADNVVLDLRGYQLTSVTTQFNTIGILATSSENLTIKNGTIANMGLGGIKCDQCANVVIKDIVVDGLNLENTAVYTVPVGILVTSSLNAEIKKCAVKNIDVKTGSTAAIQLTETLSSKVSECTVFNLLNRDGACTGIGHLLCDLAEVKECKLDRIKSEFIDNLNTEGHTAIGIVPVGTTNLKIKKCAVSNVTGCCDDAHGMSIFECVGAKIKKCKVKNVLDGEGAAHTGAKATGIEVYASGVEVIECSVKNISAINPQDKQATGFSCAQCIGVAFIKCKAENVNVYDENGNQNSSLGYGTGFGWAPDPRPEFIVPAIEILYSHCTAKKCQVGFDTWFHIDSLWDHIFSDKNVIPILNLVSSQRTLSCNACSECGCTAEGCYPEPITVTIDNVAQNNTFIDVKIKN